MESSGRTTRRGMGRGRVTTRSPSPNRAPSPASSLSESTVSGVGELFISGGVVTGLPDGAVRGTAGTGKDYDVDLNFIVTRPDGKVKTGNKGAPLKMKANFYKLKHVPTWSLYQYHVEFQPDEDRTRVKKMLMRDVAKPMGVSYMFDGAQLFTAKLLTGERGNPLAEGEQVTRRGEGVRNKGKPEEEKYPVDITIKLIRKLNSGSSIYTQLYNVLIKKCLFGLELEMIGRNFFDPHAAIKLPQQRLELWPGYITSIRKHEEDLMLCVEVTHKVLRMDSVLELIRQIKSKKNCGSDRGALTKAVNDELRDTIVMTMYNRKTYHVDDVDFSRSPKSTFETKHGAMSYVDYYKTKYGIDIKDLDQPLLLSNPRKEDVHRGVTNPAYLIPELCQSTGLTDDMRADFRLMKTLSEYLHQGPTARVKEIDHFMVRLRDNEPIQRELQGWGLEFERDLVDVTGRVLSCESMLFANNSTQPVDQKGDFTLAFRSKQMLSSVDLRDWVILVPQRDASGVDNLVRTMSKVSSPLNMKIANPKEIVKLGDARVTTYLRALDDIFKKGSDPQMLFVILPNNKLDLYAAVKKRLAVDAGVPSQCFLSKNVGSKGLMSIATKVVVQMNAKLGGEPWSIKLPLKGTMFVGFDVYHGAKGSKGGSIGAMVATFSPQFTKYFSTTSTFNSNDDLSRNMRTDIMKCVKAFQAENKGEYPEKIIMYRDGVGDGQLPYVILTEMAELKTELAERYLAVSKEPPRLTFIVVTKRINTRVFQVKQGAHDNPPPGTVVDSVVTLPERFDFYLISCAARQGTVSPCAYNVLVDDSNFEPDRIQLITYKLCHMYFNWSGTIAVPAPCQYAHKLAFLTGMAYSGHANEKLSKLLHFL